MKKDIQCFIGQKAFIQKGNHVLVLNDSRKDLDFPGGRIKEGETDLKKSLQREVREETGLEIIVGEPFATWMITLPSYHIHAGTNVYIVAYKCEYVSGEVILSDEHNSYNWVTKDTYEKVNTESVYFDVLKKYFV